MNMGATAIRGTPKKVERPRSSYKANQNSNRGVLAITEDKPISIDLGKQHSRPLEGPGYP